MTFCEVPILSSSNLIWPCACRIYGGSTFGFLWLFLRIISSHVVPNSSFACFPLMMADASSDSSVIIGVTINLYEKKGHVISILS